MEMWLDMHFFKVDVWLVCDQEQHVRPSTATTSINPAADKPK